MQEKYLTIREQLKYHLKAHTFTCIKLRQEKSRQRDTDPGFLLCEK